MAGSRQGFDTSVRLSGIEADIGQDAPGLWHRKFPVANSQVICFDLLCSAVAVRGLTHFDDPAIDEKLAASYGKFHPAGRAAVIDALVSRPAFAKVMLDSIGTGKIPRADVTPFHARQIRSFNDGALTKQFGEVWGELRDSAADKLQLIAKLKRQLTPEVLAKADSRRGRVVFNTLCAACHTLYGSGGALDPDLAGSGRDNLDYLLNNIADPNAVGAVDFRMAVVTLKDGRVLNGFAAARTDRTLTLKTMMETVTVERTEVTSLVESPHSIMPEGLLETLDEAQTRDLVTYLMSKSQVPLPE